MTSQCKMIPYNLKDNGTEHTHRVSLPRLLCVLLILILNAIPLLASAGRAPNLSLKDLEGKHQNLSALRGQIVVVNFWATWCGPCQEELPRLSLLAKEWTGKDVRVVAVSIDEAKDTAKIVPLLERLQIVPSTNFEIWTGSGADTLPDFGLGNIVPGTVVIDPEGNIVTRIMGEAKNEDLRTAVDWLSGGRSGTPPPSLVKRY